MGHPVITNYQGCLKYLQLFYVKCKQTYVHTYILIHGSENHTPHMTNVGVSKQVALLSQRGRALLRICQ